MVDAIHQTAAEQHAGLQRLALLATGNTGADIERLVREVRRKTRRQHRPLTWSDLERALLADQTKLSDDFRWRTAIHETGHAIAFYDTGIAEVVVATIGIGGIGKVVSRQHIDLPQTQDWLMRYIACLLAGRAAEMMVFGEALAGAGGEDGSDLARATEYAVAAETRLGFSSHQPLLYRSAAVAFKELSLDGHLRDRVNDRLLEAEDKARRILEDRRGALIAIATRLKDVGVMAGEEIRQLLGVPVGPST